MNTITKSSIVSKNLIEQEKNLLVKSAISEYINQLSLDFGAQQFKFNTFVSCFPYVENGKTFDAIVQVNVTLTYS